MSFCKSAKLLSFKSCLKLFHTPFNLYLGQFLLVSFCTYTYSVVCHTQNTHSPSLKKLPTFSHQMMSQEEKQKFYTDNIVPQGNFALANQKHYPDLGCDTTSVWNFFANSSDVILWGNQWWHCKMSAVFPVYYQHPYLRIICSESVCLLITQYIEVMCFTHMYMKFII